VARARGVDLLRQGSGNIGATNVGRVLGRNWGVVVFLLDFAKGALPVLAASWVSQPEGWPARLLPVLAGVAAFLGHLFPIYLHFRGGKGVATAAGVVAVLVPLPFLGAFLAWLTLFVSTRYMSLASMLAAVVLCVLRLVFTPHPWGPDEAVVSGFCLAAAGLVIVRHHANVRRLFQGTENRFKDTPAMSQLVKTLHLFAVALWFGSVVFFTLAGVILFQTFEKLSVADPHERWLPTPEMYQKKPPSDKYPDPLVKEQGSRLAGAAVGPLFPWYFGIQAVCGVVALVTALAWLGRGGRVHRLRVLVLLAALLTVGAGWWLETVVVELRQQRNAQSDEVLSLPNPGRALRTQAEKSRAEFGMWHGYSLIDNFATLALVTLAMALAARLPEGAEAPQAKESARKEPTLAAT
jgi:acyl-phosphate glycerol 3-phosphate acyltransferase